MDRRARLWALLALIWAPAMLLPLGRPDAAVSQDVPVEQKSLTARLLVAAPGMGDPRFAETVILMVHHDKDGAFGLVINRPVATRSYASLLEAMGEDSEGAAEGSLTIHYGGPVQPEIGFVLHSAEYHRPETLAVDGHIAMTASREILRDIAHDKGPRSRLVIFGYAGWAGGQLEAEMARGDWFIAADDPHLVFELDRDKLWDAAMERRLQDL